MYTTIGNKKEIILTGFDPFILNEFDNKTLKEFNYVPNPTKTKPLPNQKLNQGSGGDYLSNEIF